MKRLYLTVIVLLFLAIVGGVLFWWLQTNVDEDSAVLVYENGLVSYKLPGQSEYTILEEEEVRLPTGSFVLTDKDSYARVFLPDNSLVSLSADTEIQVTYADLEVDIQQLVGKTWNRVRTLSAGGKYEVTTPNTIAAVRGTTFDVVNDEMNNTEVHVDESNVEVQTYVLDENGDVKLLQSSVLGSGEWVAIKHNELEKEFVKKTVSKEFQESYWVKRNKILDQITDDLKDTARGPRLRSLVRQRLTERKDFVDYRFGPAANADQVGERLEVVKDILKVSRSTCDDFSQADFADAIYKVNRYARFIDKSDALAEILETISRACEDGELTVNEAEELKVLIGTFRS